MDIILGPVKDFFLTGPGAGATAALALLFLSRLLPDKAVGKVIFKICKALMDIGRAKVGVAFWVPIRKKFIQHSFQVITGAANDAFSFYDQKDAGRMAILKKYGLYKDNGENTSQ